VPRIGGGYIDRTPRGTKRKKARGITTKRCFFVRLLTCCAAAATGAFLFALGALGAALPLSVSYTVGSELIDLNSRSLQAKQHTTSERKF
jgi:hypothetical protein